MTLMTKVLALVALALQARAHMEMSNPYPINSNLNSAVPDNLKDYSYTSPLNADGSNFPCKGYQNQRPILVTAHYKAGSTYNVTIAGSASHGGGSCQMLLSYDNGKTFRVIKSMIGGCPLTTSYDFTIPSYAPSGTALLGWAWYNKIGNRELYMDCAWVDITTGGAKKLKQREAKLHPKDFNQRRAQFTSFDSLPYMWRANMAGLNTCATVEGIDPVFPNPGPDVVYGDGFSASSPPTTGNCDAVTPYGKAYKSMSVPNSGGSGGSSAQAPSAGSSAPASSGVASSTPAAISSTPVSSIAATSVPAAFSSAPALSSAVPPYANTSAISTSLGYVGTQAPSPTSPSGSSSTPGSTTGSSSCGGAASGTFKCLNGGKAFAMCNFGTWVNMGSVAAGTICRGADGAATMVAG